MKASENDVLQQKQEEARAQQGPRKPRGRIPWFKLDVGKTAKVRFLWERRDGLVLARHDEGGPPRPGKARITSCYRNVEYGEKDCPECANKVPIKKEHFWLVYNYAAPNTDGSFGQVQLLHFRDTAYTPVKQLKAMEESFGTIKDRDLTIQRIPAPSPQGSTIPATQYLAIPDSPTKFAFELSDVPSEEDVIEYLRPWEVKDGR